MASHRIKYRAGRMLIVLVQNTITMWVMEFHGYGVFCSGVSGSAWNFMYAPMPTPWCEALVQNLIWAAWWVDADCMTRHGWMPSVRCLWAPSPPAGVAVGLYLERHMLQLFYGNYLSSLANLLPAQTVIVSVRLWRHSNSCCSRYQHLTRSLDGGNIINIISQPHIEMT